MVRLPNSGGDNGVWGDLLNEFLRVEHNEDGTLKAAGSLSSAVPKSRIVAAGTGLSGGGDMTADRTLSVVYGATAGTAVEGNDSRLQAMTAYAAIDTPAAGVMAALRRGESTTIQLVGDSTGDAMTEWFGLLGQKIGAAYPNFNVLWRPWNATNQWYDLPTTLQSGPNGDSKVTLSNSPGLRYAASAITGDLDVRVRVKPNSWASGGLQVAASRWEQTTGNQRGWWFGVTATGLLCPTWTTDGTSGTQSQVFSSIANGLSNASPQWIRATLDVDNGASGRTVTFYTSSNGSNWTQLGSAQTGAGVTSIHASTSAYQMGALDSTLGSTFLGEYYWVEVRDGIAGVSVVPPLPDTWDQVSNSTTGSVVLGGSPTLLLVSGSEGAQNIAYFDNATRRPRLLSAHKQDLIFLSSGHNEAQYTTQTWVTVYATWVSNIKSLFPYVPIVALTQNPAKSPTSQNGIEVRARRGSTLMTYARSQAGIYGIDTYPAFTDVATQVSSDGIHPTASGHQAWCDYVYRSIFVA